MKIAASSKEYVFVPLVGPAGTDLSQFVTEIAIILETAGEPLDTDFHAASYVPGPDPSLLVGPGSSFGALAVGHYMAWGRITAGSEKPVIKAGRITVGDPD